MIRVLIVDDHPLVAEGVEAVLQREPDIQVVGVARTAVEAEEIARRDHPQVVMMDFRLPDRSGAEAAAAIRSEQPEVAGALSREEIDSLARALVKAQDIFA